MKPLVILIVVFLGSLATFKVFNVNYNYVLSGKLALSAMLLFTAVGHFAFTKGMTMMLPSVIPLRTTIIYLTGFIEIAAAIGLLIPQLSLTTAYLLIVFFILILPANIYAAYKRIDFQKASFGGKGLNYLWFRIPLQFLFIAWTYFFAINNG